MKILVYIGGTTRGLNLAVAGEGRYAMNMADALAHFGHDVACWGCGVSPDAAPGWGHQPPVKNIRMLNHAQAFRENFDVSLYTPWETWDPWGRHILCHDGNIKARLIVHCTFSYNEQIDASTAERCPCWSLGDESHIVVKAYPKIYDWKTKFNVRLLPFPFYKDFSDLTLEERKNILWTCKGVFVDEWLEEKYFHKPAVKFLSIIKRISDERKVGSTFIFGSSFHSGLSERLGAAKIFDGIDNKTVFPDTIDRDVLLWFAKRARFAPIFRGWFGACFDLIGSGTVPIFHTGHGIEFDNLPTDTHISEEMSEEDIYCIINRLYDDDVFYVDQIEKYREATKILTYDSFYDHFKNIISEFRGMTV